MFKLLTKSWNAAFSKESNLKAWDLGGFGASGITMAPLWNQKALEAGAGVMQRALTHMERRKVCLHHRPGPIRAALSAPAPAASAPPSPPSPP